jgi:hypothetical protein
MNLIISGDYCFYSKDNISHFYSIKKHENKWSARHVECYNCKWKYGITRNFNPDIPVPNKYDWWLAALESVHMPSDIMHLILEMSNNK